VKESIRRRIAKDRKLSELNWLAADLLKKRGLLASDRVELQGEIKIRQETEDSIPPHLRTASVQLRSSQLRMIECSGPLKKRKPSKSDTNA